MGLSTRKCDVCGKETDNLYCFAGLELDSECFATLIRVSQYNHNHWSDDEKECVSKFLKTLFDEVMVKGNEVEEVGE